LVLPVKGRKRRPRSHWGMGAFPPTRADSLDVDTLWWLGKFGEEPFPSGAKRPTKEGAAEKRNATKRLHRRHRYLENEKGETRKIIG